MKITATVQLISQSGESFPGDMIVERDGDIVRMEMGGGKHCTNGYEVEFEYSDLLKLNNIFKD